MMPLVNDNSSLSSEDLVELTAQIGQRLLHRNKELEDQVNDLQMKLEESTRVITELTQQLTDQLVVQRELQTVHLKYEQLQASSLHTEQTNERLLDELNSQKDKTKKLLNDLQDQTTQKENLHQIVKHAEDQAFQYRSHIERLETQERESKKMNQHLCAEIEKLKESLHASTECVKDVERKLLTAQNTLKVSRQEDDLQQVTELQRQIAQLQHEKDSIMKAFRELMHTNQKQQEEYELLLENTRSSLCALQTSSLQENNVTHEDSAINGTTLPEVNQLNLTPEALKLSIFDELSKEIEMQLTQRSERQKPDESFGVPSMMNENLSPSESYFYLCACAIKIKLTLELEKDPNFAEYHVGIPLNLKNLYEIAKQENVPFHCWHSWIKKQFMATVTQMKSTAKASSIMASSSLSPMKLHRHPVVFNVSASNMNSSCTVAVVRKKKVDMSNKSV